METEKRFVCHFEAIPEESPEFCLEGVCCGIYGKPSILLKVIWVIVLIFVVSPILYYAYYYYNAKKKEENEKGPPSGPEAIRAPLSRNERIPDNTNQNPKVKENSKQDQVKKKSLERDKTDSRGGKKADDKEKRQEISKEKKSDPRGEKRADDKEKPQDTLPKYPTKDGKQVSKEEAQLKMDSVKNNNSKQDISNDNSRVKIKDSSKEDHEGLGSLKSNISSKSNKITSRKLTTFEKLPNEEDQSDLDEDESNNNSQEVSISDDGNVVKKDSMKSELSLREKDGRSGHQNSIDLKNNDRTNLIDDSIPKEHTKSGERDSNDSAKAKIEDGKSNNPKPGSSRGSDSINKKETLKNNPSLGTENGGSGNQKSPDNKIHLKRVDSSLKAPTQGGYQASNDETKPIADGGQNTYSDKDTSKNNEGLLMRENLIDSDNTNPTVVENNKALSPSNDPLEKPKKDEKRDNDDEPQPEMDVYKNIRSKRNISQETNSMDKSEDYLSVKSNLSREEEIKENRNLTDIKNQDEISSTNNISKDKNTKKVLQSKIDNVQNYPLKRDSSMESDGGKKRGSLIRKLSLGRERSNSKDSNKSPGKSVK